MQRTRTFVWNIPGAAHPGEGAGWLPVNAAPGWFPGPGFLTAHDVMEHLSDKPDWQHELRAAGVAMFGIDAVIFRNATTVAEDVTNFAARDHHFAVPKAPARWHKPLPAKHEEVIQSLGDEIDRLIKRGLSRAKKRGIHVPEDALRNAPHFVANAMPWFRLGYRAAQRAYGADNGRKAGELMNRVREAINIDHDDLPPLEGEHLSVTIDTKALTFKIERKDTKKVSGMTRASLAFTDELLAFATAPKAEPEPIF